VLVTHAYNLSYSGGRDQENRMHWANSSRDPIFKIPITKKGLLEWFKVNALSSITSIATKKKKRLLTLIK
jgi:hypothetical protein